MLTSHISRRLICLLLLFLSPSAFSQITHIVVSTKPLHSLVSQISGELHQTELLLNNNQSPHHFQLRPSQKRMLARAQLFIFASSHIESFAQQLQATSDKLKFIELSKVPGLHKLELRSIDSHQHATSEHSKHSEHSDYDGHIWLSIENAIAVSTYISQYLSEAHPENALFYQQNLQQLIQKLTAVKQENLQLLKPHRNTAFLVYHDAYQYFEHENRLNEAHFVTSGAEHSPGIKRVSYLIQKVKDENIRCIFYEPPNIPSLVSVISQSTRVKLAPLDPLGSQIPEGEEHYINLIRNTAQTINKCLTPQGT